MSALGDLLRATKEESGVDLGDLTVLSPQIDPFRLDTPTNHEVGKWFRDQMEACGLLDRENAIHNLFEGSELMADGNRHLVPSRIAVGVEAIEALRERKNYSNGGAR